MSKGRTMMKIARFAMLVGLIAAGGACRKLGSTSNTKDDGGTDTIGFTLMLNEQGMLGLEAQGGVSVQSFTITGDAKQSSASMSLLSIPMNLTSVVATDQQGRNYSCQGSGLTLNTSFQLTCAVTGGTPGGSGQSGSQTMSDEAFGQKCEAAGGQYYPSNGCYCADGSYFSSPAGGTFDEASFSKFIAACGATGASSTPDAGEATSTDSATSTESATDTATSTDTDTDTDSEDTSTDTDSWDWI